MTLDHYISELLEDQDCVIIPDFGGFIGNYASARINPVNHRIDPPFRKITFNKLLVHNDGLLAAYIAKKEEEKYESALARIKNYSVYLKSELNANQRINIDKVGILYKQADGTFRFEQFKDAKFFSEGFGLESFYSKSIVQSIPSKVELEPKPVQPQLTPHTEKETPIVEKKPVLMEPVVVKLNPQENPSEEKRSKRYWPAAAAIISLPILGYLAWVAMGTTLLTERQSFQYSDLNPFTEKICPEYVVRSSVFSTDKMEDVLSTEAADSASYLEIESSDNRDKTLVVSLEDKVKHVPKVAVSSEALVYHIIGGCFSDQSNAEGLVSKYKELGSNPSIIDQKGSLNRVSVGSYATKKEALQALASFRNEIPNAWLLHK